MSDSSQFHENRSHSDKIKVGSERAFGLVFAIVFVLVGLAPLLDQLPVRIWALATAGGFVFAALITPNILRPLNLIWFKFGLLLHKIVNPVIMGLLFVVTIVPMALIFRLIGKDPLNRKLDPEASSYWIRRSPPGPTPDSMKNQF